MHAIKLLIFFIVLLANKQYAEMAMQKVINITKIDCYNPNDKNIFTSFGCYLTLDSRGCSAINMNMVFRESFTSIPFYVDIQAKVRDRYVPYMKFNTNFCRFGRDQRKNYVVDLILDSWFKSINRPISCPPEQDFHYMLRNFTLSNYNIPPYLPTFEFIFNAEGRTSHNARPFNLKTYGKIISLDIQKHKNNYN